MVRKFASFAKGEVVNVFVNVVVVQNPTKIVVE